MYAEPHSYDLCLIHSEKLTLPNGWSFTKIEPEDAQVGPSDDDLMLIANAVRDGANPDTSGDRAKGSPSRHTFHPELARNRTSQNLRWNFHKFSMPTILK